jgi:hypothetical protein
LEVGGVSVFGLGLPQLLAQAAEGQARQSKAQNCILIWLDGGPSHLETFDVKPLAPQEVRGPLDSIATAIPGFAVSECLPETAKRAQDVAFVNSMTSPLGEHNFGTHYMMTGYRPTPVVEYPVFNSVVPALQLRTGSVLPDHVAVPDFRVGGGKLSGNGFLPQPFAPFSIGADPAKKDFKVRDLEVFQRNSSDQKRLPAKSSETAANSKTKSDSTTSSRPLSLDRLSRRREFVQKLDQFSDDLDRGAVINDPSFDQAWRLISSTDAKQAFDLEAESTQMRNRYGRRSVGQGCLLARRLLERGVRCVTVNYRGWDTHKDLYTRLKEGYTGARTPVGLIPSLDLAFSALIDDLRDRSLLDETLIVAMGEFGRTPKLNTNGGRDHWPRVFSVVMAGGGVQGGQVIGSSDSTGESPANQPVTPADLVHSIYTLMGIEPDKSLTTPDGRPIRLTNESSSLIEGLVS